MLAGRSWESWIAEYSQSHQHPLNRLTHTFGIPIILLSLPLFLAGLVWHRALWVAAALFVFGWALQFLGHHFEGKRPALLDNLFQAFVGPMFLVAEVMVMNGYRRDLANSVAQGDLTTL